MTAADVMNANTGLIQNIRAAGLAACEGADSFLQSAMWGDFKFRFGWEPRAFLVDWAGFGARSLLVLSRRLVPGFSFAYVPWGPELPPGFPPEAGPRALAELGRALRQLLPRHTAFIRFDPPWSAGDGAFLPGPPFIRAAADIQPPDTVLVDLSPERRDILAAMKPKWRYNIGLAEKRGVTVSRRGGAAPDEKDIAAFYRLLAETAERDGILVHQAGYYQTLFELCRSAASGELRLYFAEHEGDTLAAVAVLCRRKQATYLYGASANIKRNLMAPYALQWRAMGDAKDSGCVLYDMFGIAPDDDPRHPMAGLYRFKTGFGGTIIHRPGSWDYPCKPVFRALFGAAEGLRKKLRDARKTGIPK
jgi:lipid II:glycine glycyltransferase (peptidoglycan interpeptide bridge formation enzyme)